MALSIWTWIWIWIWIWLQVVPSCLTTMISREAQRQWGAAFGALLEDKMAVGARQLDGAQQGEPEVGQGRGKGEWRRNGLLALDRLTQAQSGIVPVGR